MRRPAAAAALASVLLAGCASDAESWVADPNWRPPMDAGPWNAATVEAEVPGPDGLVLPAQLWYPTMQVEGRRHAYDGALPSVAFDDAAPHCDFPHPVVLHSHESGWMRWDLSFLHEHLAARGWVVVSVDHTGDALWDRDDDAQPATWLRRPADLAAAYDWLLETEADGALAGCIDPALGFVVTGGEIGAAAGLVMAGAVGTPAATEAACARADLPQCGVAAAAWETGAKRWAHDGPRPFAVVGFAPAARAMLGSNLGGVEVPELLWGSADDTTASLSDDIRPTFSSVGASPKYLGVIDNASHATFSGECDWGRNAAECESHYRRYADVHDILVPVTTAFLDIQRGRDARAWLPGDAEGLTWTER